MRRLAGARYAGTGPDDEFSGDCHEAFIDLLRTHDRPVDLKDALKRSVKERPHAG
jgi:hypothetical protein